MFSHFTLVLESELSNVLETYTRAAWLLNLSIKKKKKKNQPKPIIRTEITVPNVQKCVMVTTFTLHKYMTVLILKKNRKFKKISEILVK